MRIVRSIAIQRWKIYLLLMPLWTCFEKGKRDWFVVRSVLCRLPLALTHAHTESTQLATRINALRQMLSCISLSHPLEGTESKSWFDFARERAELKAELKSGRVEFQLESWLFSVADLNESSGNAAFSNSISAVVSWLKAVLPASSQSGNDRSENLPEFRSRMLRLIKPTIFF